MTRRRHWRTAGTVLAAVTLTTATAMAANPADADQTRVLGQAATTINWGPCEQNTTFDCGTLVVPIDWSTANGPTIELALARHKATGSGATRVGSLLVNPGGPGGSGVDMVLEMSGSLLAPLNERFDLVGFDPRGVGRSHPVTCATALVNAIPEAGITSQSDFDQVVATNRRLAADCRQRTGVLFDHVDAISVVRDMDAIRATLGEPKLNYLGFSYGTLFGQQYAELFGDRIRAMVLDGNMDHSLGAGEFLTTNAASVQDSFDEFVAWCDRTQPCPLRQRGVRTVFADLRSRAQRGDLSSPFQSGSAMTLSGLLSFTEQALSVPAWIDLAQALAKLDASTTRPGGMANPSGETAAAETTTYAAPIFCEDWRIDIRGYHQYQRYMDKVSSVAADTAPPQEALYYVNRCLGWPGQVNNPQHVLRVRTSPTLLLMNTRHDPATGYPWAVGAARQLANHAVLVTYEGWGHTSFWRSDCTKSVTNAYLTDLVLPEPGTTCTAPDATVQEPASQRLLELDWARTFADNHGVHR